VLINANDIENNEKLGKSVRTLISKYGGQEALYNDCNTISYYKDDNYYETTKKCNGQQNSFNARSKPWF
jgi:hypothetical protein